MPVTIGGSGPITGVTSINTTVSDTELGYLDGVTSALQTQINAKANLASPTFTGTLKMGDNLITGVGSSTGDCQIEVGGDRTGNGNAYVDLHATAGTDYELRLFRSGGTNGNAELTNLGTGSLFINQNGSTGFELRGGSAVKSTTIYNSTSSAGANMFIETAAGADQGLLKRSTSSIKYKTDVETMEDDYADRVLALRPVWFRSTCEGDVALHPDWSYYGLIAEEVAEVEPRLVHFGGDDPENPEPEGVQYDRLVVHLLSIVQRQQDRIAALEARLDAAGL